MILAAVTQKGVVKALKTHIEALNILKKYFTSVISYILPTNALSKRFMLQMNVCLDQRVMATRAALPAENIVGTVLNSVVGLVDDVIDAVL